MKDLTPIIEIDQCSTIKEDYNKFCETVKCILKKYQIPDVGRRFMVMPYFNGLPFRIAIKHVDDRLKIVFYFSIFIDGIEIDITDIIFRYGITDDFINELVCDIKKVYGNISEIILRGTIGIKKNINEYCFSKHITKEWYIMEYIFDGNTKDIFFYVDHMYFNRKGENIYERYTNAMNTYLRYYEFYQILRVDDKKTFNKMFCWNYSEILDRINSKIGMDFFIKNYQIADGYKIIEFNDFTRWYYIIGEIKNRILS